MKKLELPGSQAVELEALVRKKMHIHEPPTGFRRSRSIQIRDANDRPLVDLALSSDADVLLSWDHDLLALMTVGRTQIMSPRQFWDSLAPPRV